MGQIAEFTAYKDVWKHAIELEELARTGDPYFIFAYLEQHEMVLQEQGQELPPPLRLLKRRLSTGEFGDVEILTSLSNEKVSELESIARDGDPYFVLAWLQNFRERSPFYANAFPLQQLRERIIAGEFGDVSDAEKLLDAQSRAQPN